MGQTCCLLVLYVVLIGIWVSVGFLKLVCRIVFRTTSE